MTTRICTLAACAALIACITSPSHASHAVVLVYHHVSEDTPSSTSVTPGRFEAHLEHLEDSDFEVWPLYRLLAAAVGGRERVPQNVVAITFDDAYESVYTEAWPRLRERGWPFAVFANTDAIDAGHSPYMSWDQLRTLYENGVSIGNHSASHAHLIERLEEETRSEWATRVSADIVRASERIAEEVGVAPDLFAYPYGEDSAELAELVDEHHDFALTQRSGAVGGQTDPLSVPRFPMASNFDGMDRFALAINTRPLPVLESRPSPPGDGVRGPVESLRLSLAEGGYRSGQLACYSGSGERLVIDFVEGPPHRLVIDIGGAGATGRNKINCTAPASDGSGDFFWYAFQWVQDAVRD